MVIPKQLRDRYHLQPGAELEIQSGVDGISIKVHSSEPALIKKQGILVHHGPETVTIDTAAYIDREREYRNSQLGGEIAAEHPHS